MIDIFIRVQENDNSYLTDLFSHFFNFYNNFCFVLLQKTEESPLNPVMFLYIYFIYIYKRIYMYTYILYYNLFMIPSFLVNYKRVFNFKKVNVKLFANYIAFENYLIMFIFCNKCVHLII